MKKLLHIVLFIIPFLHAAAKDVLKKEDGVSVTQEVRYTATEATEMYIVWGINNWVIPESKLWPEGSFLKDKLVFTPMKKKPYGFAAEIRVPANTVIDYVFWIAKGPAGKTLDIWDLNEAPQKDYHSMVMNNNTVLINSKVSARPKEVLSLLDFTVPLLSLSATLFFFFLIIRESRYKDIPMHIGSVKIIVATSLVLSLFLVLLRSSVTGQCWDLYLHPVMSFPKVLWAGFYDVMFVMITGCLFLFLAKFFAHKERAGKIIIGSFVFVSFLSLLAGILNVQVVQIIGKPFNYPWFYYSDFLQSSDAKSAVASNISSSYVLQVIMVCVSAFLLVMMFIVIADMMVRKLRMKGPIISTLVCCSAVYITIAPDAIDNYKWDYDKLSNPVVAFAASANPFSEEPQLFTMSVSDTLKFDIFKNKQAPASKPIPSIKNVIVFVMESTPAEYIQPYSSSYKLTPELEKYLPQSVVFENVYAHAPSTNNSMVSILGSSYPWLTYNSVTMEHPDIALQTISSELKRKGYRTGFFNSADNRFQKAGEFLSNRKFDAIKDYNNLQCHGNFEVKDDHWDYLNGKDDECTADDMITWIKQNSGQPFFSMMWTYQTHYPYFATGAEKKYSQDEILNRYLNAVNHSDKVLGKLLDELKRSGLYESTLVVVVGDHGEAFGRHGQTHHASKIYEENLHVPCIFINPAFKGEHKQGIGGLIDIAPTIMNTLGFSSPEMWHGKDLFTATENDRVYFFTPWSDYLFGYREGNMKYIFNATKNSTEIYDLKNDPFEENNIASKYPESAELSHQRIAGWVQSVNRFMGNLLTSHKNAN